MSIALNVTVPATRRAKTFGKVVLLPFIAPRADIATPVLFTKTTPTVPVGAFGKLDASTLLWSSSEPVTTDDGIIHANQTIANAWTMALATVRGVTS